MPDNADELKRLLRSSVDNSDLQKAVFSAPRTSVDSIHRVTVRPIMVRGARMLQFTSQTSTQEFHQNRTGMEAANELVRLAVESFRNIHLTTPTTLVEAKFSRREKCLLRSSQNQSASKNTAPPPEHNRQRNHLIPEGVPCAFLVHMGVMNSEGVVKANHSKKFRQINRYLEFIRDIADHLPTHRPIHVVDFGCGKSYLTFATHYMLTHIFNRDCKIVGLDRRQDVIQTCTKIANDLELKNLSFQMGDIASFHSAEDVDMVISLHACDTATDEAIAQAIRWNCKVILAVPCCQHELNAHLSEDALPPITSYGVSKERFASLMTDTMRSTLLNAIGYQTQLMEFIETEHTPKNLLIRSIRKDGARTAMPASLEAIDQILNMRKTLGIPSLTLERRLSELGHLDSHLSK